MATLPEAYHLDRIYEGMLTPDYEALQRALPPRVPEGQEPEILPLRELGDRILAVSETLPKIGKQGTFGYIYGSLTHVLADMVDGKPGTSFLPTIENPDDLIRQASYFAQSWFDPLDDYKDQAIAGARGEYQLQRKIVDNMAPHWLGSLENAEIQFGEEVTQFAPDMEGHILVDLGRDLVRSRVSFAYMRRGGDFDKVNVPIRYVTTMKAPELIDGRVPIVRAAVQPFATAIGGMRRVAKRTHHRLHQAESQEEFDAIQRQATERGIRVIGATAKYGDVAIRCFARAAGAKHLAQQIGNGLSSGRAA